MGEICDSPFCFPHIFSHLSFRLGMFSENFIPWKSQSNVDICTKIHHGFPPLFLMSHCLGPTSLPYRLYWNGLQVSCDVS
jgi:hypothetical protein